MRVGILIIGSLYWDPSPTRCSWRRERLDCAKPTKVKAPIRYGKKAETRGDTYTMVFSMSCATAETLGTALVVPARASCCGIDHLLDEARWLWEAERNEPGRQALGSSWGMTCILKNPRNTEHGHVLEGWSSAVAATRQRPIAVTAGEKAAVDHKEGLALFDWPADLEGKPLSGYDVLMMTANEHKPVENAPSAQEIAQVWLDDTHGNVNYFYNNTHSGITTYQDGAVAGSSVAMMRRDPSGPRDLPQRSAASPEQSAALPERSAALPEQSAS